jgi:phosphate transport system permease protein
MDTQTPQLHFGPGERQPELIHFRAKSRDLASFLFTGLTGAATWLIISMLVVILINIFVSGWEGLSWRFITSNSDQNMFDIQKAGVLPMIVGTSARVMLMTLFVIPVGVTTAVYLTEYAKTTSPLTRIIRGAVNNLAGVPSIVFGLFGLGFFILFVGGLIDSTVLADNPEPKWGKPAILWASLTLAVMTLPVVIVATEESLKAIPQGLREASLALGATKLQTILKVVLPQALPGIMTGGILSISRAAGEVAPILFTGAAYYMSGYPKALTDQFMDLGYHVYILSTQSTNVDQTAPILYATVVVLLLLTFALNLVAIVIRSRMRKQMRAMH